MFTLHNGTKSYAGIDLGLEELQCQEYLALQLISFISDFGIVDFGSISTYENLYKTLLWKYGCLIGTYQAQIGPFGGFFEVKYKDGKLLCIEWRPDIFDVQKPLQEVPLFIIDGARSSFQCMCASHPDPCTLEIKQIKGTWVFHCQNSEEHIKSLMEILTSYKLMTFHSVLSAGIEFKLFRIPASSDIPRTLLSSNNTCPSEIFSPGLFKGTYGAHGIEIIMFRYKDENEIHGVKVTGDPNVFASEITVKVCLRYPVIVSDEEQRELSSLKRLKAELKRDGITSGEKKPFIIPEGCTTRGYNPPSHCIARYHGFGQVAHFDFVQPSFIPVHVMVFSNDVIGVLWLDLECFSAYERIHDSFVEPSLKDCPSAL
ncbi:F-box only protein 31-like isoform X2 [Oratosquilla oratoria]|uniref:F-box only protein 31-like isoform X2 n=1 Tax=Oratosquilla oratoria TaxID=337810 RepID=UPI003F77372A